MVLKHHGTFPSFAHLFLFVVVCCTHLLGFLRVNQVCNLHNSQHHVHQGSHLHNLAPSLASNLRRNRVDNHLNNQLPNQLGTFHYDFFVVAYLSTYYPFVLVSFTYWYSGSSIGYVNISLFCPRSLICFSLFLHVVQSITRVPSTQPSSQPSQQPTMQPSRQPSQQPSTQPSQQPTMQPSRQPSQQPSSQPTR